MFEIDPVTAATPTPAPTPTPTPAPGTGPGSGSTPASLIPRSSASAGPSTGKTVPGITPGPASSTSSTTTPAAAPADQPFFTGGDWITLGVGLLAALIAWRAKRTSDRATAAAVRAADANEKMVVEQAKANKLADEEIKLLKQHRGEDLAAGQARVEAADHQRAVEARRRAAMVGVRVKVWNNAVDVVMRNDSPATVTQVQIVNVVCSNQPEWRWELDEYAHSRLEDPLACDVLTSRHEHPFHVLFTNEAGEKQPTEPGMTVVVTYRFTDGGDQRWERTDNGDPRPTDS